MSVKWLTKKDKNGRIIRYSVPWYDYDYYGMFSENPGQSTGGPTESVETGSFLTTENDSFFIITEDGGYNEISET